MSEAETINAKRDLAHLSEDECWQLLREHGVGRLAFCLEGRPHLLPITHGVDDGAVVFRTGPGSKLGAAAQAAEVVYEIDGFDERRGGWSVVVRGSADVVTDPDELERLYGLGLKPWAVDGQVDWVRITPSEVTGRRMPR